MRYIFDLDGTVIDSTHRQGNGSLDDWRRMDTPKNVALDSPLYRAQAPLAVEYRSWQRHFAFRFASDAPAPTFMAAAASATAPRELAAAAAIDSHEPEHVVLQRRTSLLDGEACYCEKKSSNQFSFYISIDLYQINFLSIF